MARLSDNILEPTILLRVNMVFLRLDLARTGDIFYDIVWLQMAILLFLLDYGDKV